MDAERMLQFIRSAQHYGFPYKLDSNSKVTSSQST
jgi:hypothetical protein